MLLTFCLIIFYPSLAIFRASQEPVLKNLSVNTGDVASIPGLGRFPGEGNGNPLQYSCLENPHGQRNLAGYSAWAHKDLDTIEPLTHTHIEFAKQKIKIVCVN